MKDYFDQEYYLNNYEDALNSNLHPICHYLTIGHEENKNPNAEFVTSFYKNKYPEIAKYNLNPLVHYVKWGKQEGREINYFKNFSLSIYTPRIKRKQTNFVDKTKSASDKDTICCIFIPMRFNLISLICSFIHGYSLVV